MYKYVRVDCNSIQIENIYYSTNECVFYKLSLKFSSLNFRKTYRTHVVPLTAVTTGDGIENTWPAVKGGG